tara:strand:+ start:58 stop:369 length:312 start_codon:yes stop_codon:yes gene_type:complete
MDDAAMAAQPLNPYYRDGIDRKVNRVMELLSRVMKDLTKRAARSDGFVQQLEALRTQAEKVHRLGERANNPETHEELKREVRDLMNTSKLCLTHWETIRNESP